LDLHYLIGADDDHVAKFRGDLPRELGDPKAKEKTPRLKHKAFRNYRSGRPTNNYWCHTTLYSVYAHLQNATKALLVSPVFSRGGRHIWIAGKVHVATANRAINQTVNQWIN